MLWDHLIIIFVTLSLTMVMKYLDTMPGYSCPEYCGVQHEHWDSQSEFEALLAENTKVSKNRDLAVK